MALHQDIQQSLKQALKDKDKNQVSTLRMLLSAMHNRAIELKVIDLEDQEVLAVIKKELKKRQDSMDAFQAAGRPDLYQTEKSEAEILSKYLPAALSEEELGKIVEEVLKSGLDNFGLIMKEVMARSGGRADGAQVANMVKAKMAK